MKKHLKNLEKLTRELFKKAGLEEEISEIKIEHESKEELIYINISALNPSFLIGYRGKNLYAFEHLLKSLYYVQYKELPKIILDISDYKKKNAKRLEFLAQKIADKVLRTSRADVLIPMNAYERRIIHTYVLKYKELVSESIGEEPNRRVIIKIKK